MTAHRSGTEVALIYVKAVELRKRIEELNTDDPGLALDNVALDLAIRSRWQAGSNEYKYNRLRDAIVNAEAGLQKYQYLTEEKL